MAHLDVIRGVTMLLVVAYHWGGWTESSVHNYWDYLIFLRMPMFFFISGFLVYSVNLDKTMLIKRSKNRLLAQLWPTILLFLLWIVTLCHEEIATYRDYYRLLQDSVNDVYKQGFWFTYVLVEMFFVVAPMLYLFNRFRLSNKWRVVALLGIWLLAIWFLNLCIPSDNGRGMLGYVLSGIKFKEYFLYFILGCIAKIYLPAFTSFYEKHRYGITAVVFYCIVDVILFKFIQYAPYLRDTLEVLCSCLGITAMLYLFHWLVQVKSAFVQRICSYLAIVGTSTLQIYLIHYFFLKLLSGSVLRNITLQIGERFGSITEMLFHGIMAIVVVGLCLLTVKLMKSIGIYRFVFPSKTKKVGTLKKMS